LTGLQDFHDLLFFYHEHTNKQKTGLGVVIGGTSNFLCGLHFLYLCVFFENSPRIYSGGRVQQ